MIDKKLLKSLNFSIKEGTIVEIFSKRYNISDTCYILIEIMGNIIYIIITNFLDKENNFMKMLTPMKFNSFKMLKIHEILSIYE